VDFTNHKPAHNLRLDYPSIPVESLDEYWNVMFSCHTAITAFSGGSVLAAALLERWRTPDEFKPVVIRPPGHTKGYIFDGIEYVNV